MKTAEYRGDDNIWWRGSGATFAPHSIVTMRNLLPNLTGCLADLAPDLAVAIAQYEADHQEENHVHARTDRAA